MFFSHYSLALNRPTGFRPPWLFAPATSGANYDLVRTDKTFQDSGVTASDEIGEPLGQLSPTEGAYILRQTTGSAKPTRGSVPRGGVRNLFTTATDAFSTRNFTTRAVEYTLTAEGGVGDTITLSGTSTAGPLTCTGVGNRVSLTFTPSAGTLTLTESGTVINAQIELGGSATAYQSVLAAHHITEAGVPSVPMMYFDGGDTMATTANTEFIFPDTGENFWIAGANSYWNNANGYIFAVNGGPVSADRTLALLIDTGSQEGFINARGTMTDTNRSLGSAGIHTWLLTCANGILTFYADSNAGVSIAVGAAAEIASPFLIGAREGGLSSAYVGFMAITSIGDRALSSVEIAMLRAWQKSTYGSP